MTYICIIVVTKILLILAVKCNDNLLVVEVLAALGVNFDCASKVNIVFIKNIYLICIYMRHMIHPPFYRMK